MKRRLVLDHGEDGEVGVPLPQAEIRAEAVLPHGRDLPGQRVEQLAQGVKLGVAHALLPHHRDRVLDHGTITLAGSGCSPSGAWE